MSHLQDSTIGTVHEVQTLRQELAETRKKLQDYADTVISLHGELRTLREGICNSCKQKFVPANLVSSSSQVAKPKPAPTVSSLVKSSQRPAKHTIPTFSWRRLLKTHASGHIPSSSNLSPKPEIPKESKNIPQILPLSPILYTAGEAVTQKPVRSAPHWFAKRDPTANAALDVTFVREFIQEGPVRFVRFSPDGKYLAAVVTAADYKNGIIFIYNVETGDKTCALAEYASQYSSVDVPGINCLCFSPDGSYVAVGDVTGWVTVWDIPEKQIRNKFRDHVSHVNVSVLSVDFSPNGRHVVSGSRTVHMWSMRDGSTRVLNFADRDNNLGFWSVRFSPSGQLVAAGDTDGDLRIWNVRTGQLVRRWTGHKGIVWSVAFAAEGKVLLSGGEDGVVKCWDASSLGIVQSGDEPVATKILKYEGKTNSVYAIAVSPDSEWIASGLSNNSSVISDAHSAIQQCTLIGHTESVYSVDFSPVGGYLALGSDDSHVTLWRYTGMNQSLH